MQLEAHGSRGLLLILFWQAWSKMENGLGRCLCWFCSCFCFGPFLSPKQSCSKGFMCMFSSLEFDHKFPVAFEWSDLTDREHGGHCRLLMDELGNGEVEVHEKQMPTSACKPPLCFMLSLLKWFWLFGLDSYCKLELSESMFLVSNLVYQNLLAHHILFCITVCGHDSQTHLSVSRQFCLKQREQGLSQDCTLIFLQADAPGGILEMAVGNLWISLHWLWVSHALSYYSLSWNRAFHLCNLGCFVSCVCIVIIYLLGSQNLGKSMPTFFQQVNGRAPESEPSLKALPLHALKNPDFWIAECTSPAGVAGPELGPCILS